MKNLALDKQIWIQYQKLYKLIKKGLHMKSELLSCLLNTPSINNPTTELNLFAADTADNVSRFHQSLPGYKPTPAVDLVNMSKHLGIKQLIVKDESQRFNLNAFKMLGASFAMAKHLAKLVGVSENALTFENIISKKHDYQGITFVTATDGNHGRAVAWAAQQFACNAVVYMPKGSSNARLEAIKAYGATATITDVNYDDTVLFAKQQAEKNGWMLIQDTSWEGYAEVPQHIMQGYCTLVSECMGQLEEFWPTHVFLQAGVGSLPAAIVAYMCSLLGKPKPIFIVVEPNGAPCFYKSIELGKQTPVRITGDLPTIMAGLACGEPSQIAWQILSEDANAFLSCADDVARKGMRVLAKPLKDDSAIVSGESGAVTIGALFEILSQSELLEIKNALALTKDSSVLLFSTEGDTDPEVYQDIVWN